MKSTKKKDASILPDISVTDMENCYPPLNQVGMSGVETMVLVKEEKERMLPAQADIFVDLVDTQVRGIHMSRMYEILYRELSQQEMTPQLLRTVLAECIDSQKGISGRAYIRLSFTLPLIRSSLISEHRGFRNYPIIWEGNYVASPEDNFTFFHSFKLLYSSTCPCSTALSEDLQRKQQDDFTGYVATPHAQRSEADITLGFHHLPPRNNKGGGGFITDLIDKLEGALKTPVQTAVKREDEQEFARLNAENQMFCEDAARILKKTLEKNAEISDYRVRVSHLESLHAHNAVAVAVKGVPGGLTINSSPI